MYSCIPLSLAVILYSEMFLSLPSHITHRILHVVYQRTLFPIVQGFYKSGSSWKGRFINSKPETDKCWRLIDDKNIYILIINKNKKTMNLNASFSKHRYSTKSVGFFAFDPDLWPHINISLLHNPLPSPLKTAVLSTFYCSKKTVTTRKCVEDIDASLYKIWKNQRIIKKKKAMFCILWKFVLKFKRPSRRSAIILISKTNRYCVLLVQSGILGRKGKLLPFSLWNQPLKRNKFTSSAIIYIVISTGKLKKKPFKLLKVQIDVFVCRSPKAIKIAICRSL